MKFLFFLCITFANCHGLLFAYDIRTKNNIIETNKYYLGDQSVWDDNEMNLIIANSPSSAPLTTANFTPVIISTLDVLIINEIISENKVNSRSTVLSEIETRKSKAYIIDKLSYFQKRLQTYNILNSYLGYAIDPSSTAILQQQITQYYSRYLSAK